MSRPLDELPSLEDRKVPTEWRELICSCPEFYSWHLGIMLQLGVHKACGKMNALRLHKCTKCEDFFILWEAITKVRVECYDCNPRPDAVVIDPKFLVKPRKLSVAEKLARARKALE